APHPLRLRAALFTEPFGQLKAYRYALGFQLPWLPERWLTAKGGARVRRLIHQWAGPEWPSEATRTYQDALRIPGVAHCALEYYRWFARSQFRPDGFRYARQMRTEIEAPTLQLHGAL